MPLSTDLTFIADTIENDYTFSSYFCETDTAKNHIYKLNLDFEDLTVKNYVIVYQDKDYGREMITMDRKFSEINNAFILQFETRDIKDKSLFEFLEDVEEVLASLETIAGFINQYEIVENFPALNIYSDENNNSIRDVYTCIVRIHLEGYN